MVKDMLYGNLAIKNALQNTLAKDLKVLLRSKTTAMSEHPPLTPKCLNDYIDQKLYGFMVNSGL